MEAFAKRVEITIPQLDDHDAIRQSISDLWDTPCNGYTGKEQFSGDS